MGNNIAQRSKPSGTVWLRVAVFLTHANLVIVGVWADPPFTAPLAETKHERNVILLELCIYSLITPLCPRLHTLNRQQCNNFTCFTFAYYYECREY